MCECVPRLGCCQGARGGGDGKGMRKRKFVYLSISSSSPPLLPPFCSFTCSHFSAFITFCVLLFLMPLKFIKSFNFFFQFSFSYPRTSLSIFHYSFIPLPCICSHSFRVSFSPFFFISPPSFFLSYSLSQVFFFHFLPLFSFLLIFTLILLCIFVFILYFLALF